MRRSALQCASKFEIPFFEAQKRKIEALAVPYKCFEIEIRFEKGIAGSASASIGQKEALANPVLPFDNSRPARRRWPGVGRTRPRDHPYCQACR